MSFNSSTGTASSKFGSLLSKAKSTALNAGTQASAALRDTATIASGHTQATLAGFTLPGEAEKAAVMLSRFLALPLGEEEILTPSGNSVNTDPLKQAGAVGGGRMDGVKQGGQKFVGEVKKTTEDIKKGVDGFNKIPTEVVQKAKGFAIFTILKAGFMFSGKAGSGLVVARLPDGSWSAPSCIATAGVGWGFQIGADITDVVVVLNSDDAVKAFSQGGNLQIGGTLSAAVGPIGTGAQINAALQHPAPMFSYTRSRGLFAGVSLEGTILVERKEANRAFYGSNVSAKDILSGHVPAPEIASKMYDLLEAAEGLPLTSDQSSYQHEYQEHQDQVQHGINEVEDAFTPPPIVQGGAGTGATGTGTLREEETEKKNRTVFDADDH